MKKAIVAGAASAVLAAMPVVATFAATVPSVQDTVKLTISEQCSMEAAAATNEINLGSAAAGAYGEQTGSVMTITCNKSTGWQVKATATTLTNGTASQDIPFGAYQTTDSVWSAKLALGGNDTDNATITTGWTDYSATTASDTVVTAFVKDTAVSGLTITPTYKAYAAANQQAGTYSGTITYTFVDLAPAQSGD